MKKPAIKKVFVFAHQDDEILISGKIMHELDIGSDVYLIWCNDGSGGTGLYASKEAMQKDYLPHMKPGETLDSLPEIRVKEILSIVREHESRASMNSIGMRDDNMLFLGHPAEWMRKPENIAALVAELAETLDRIAPEEIYVDAWEGAHVTHDIVNFATVHAVMRMKNPPNAFFEFPQYPLLKSYRRSILKKANKSKLTEALIHILHYGIGQFAEPIGSEIKLGLTPEQVRTKHSLMHFYTSQSKLTSDFDNIIKARNMLGAILPQLRHKPDVEYWRPVPDSLDYRMPPCRGHRYSEYNQSLSDSDYKNIFSAAIDIIHC